MGIVSLPQHEILDIQKVIIPVEEGTIRLDMDGDKVKVNVTSPVDSNGNAKETLYVIPKDDVKKILQYLYME